MASAKQLAVVWGQRKIIEKNVGGLSSGCKYLPLSTAQACFFLIRFNAGPVQPESNMQKSAHTSAPQPARRMAERDPFQDKGQKFEPFWNNAFGQDRRSQARLIKTDQKR